MEVTKKIKGECVIFGIKGSLDMNNVKFIKKIFTDATDSGAKSVAIDMNALTYIDSSGIGSFIGLMTKLRGAGGYVVLINMNEDIKRIFTMTKLLVFFKVFESEEEFYQSIVEDVQAGGSTPTPTGEGTPTGVGTQTGGSTPAGEGAGVGGGAEAGGNIKVDYTGGSGGTEG